jgi:hypothetical protein
MKLRQLAPLWLVLAGWLLAGCASAPAPDELRQTLGACDIRRDAAACRQLSILLAAGEMPRALTAEAEEAVLKACWADRMVDAELGTDTRFRLCYEAGRHFSAKAASAMEEPDTNLRKVAAYLYRRSCRLGQPQACRMLLSECLLLDGELCQAPPSEEQAQQWAAERRERDAEMRRTRVR